MTELPPCYRCKQPLTSRGECGCKDGICLILGDCRDILPLLEPGSVDLLCTDPPYPKLKGGLAITLEKGVGKRIAKMETVGTPWGNDLTGVTVGWQLCRLGALVFCSFHSVADLPTLLGVDGISLVTWYQRNATPPINNVPQYRSEFVWAFKKASGLNWRKLRSMYDIPRLQAGCMASERFCNENGQALHPAQKPLELMHKLLEIGGEVIIDPYAGVGTTLRAAKDQGRRAIGIEIEEKYAAIAANRLKQECLF